MRVFGDAHAELHFSAFQASVPQLAWIVESSLIETCARCRVALPAESHVVRLARARRWTFTRRRRARHARERRNARSGPDGRRGRRAFVGPRANGLEGDPARLSANGRRRELQGAKSRTAKPRTNGSGTARSSRSCRCRTITSRSSGRRAPNTPSNSSKLDPAQLAAEVETVTRNHARRARLRDARAGFSARAANRRPAGRAARGAGRRRRASDSSARGAGHEPRFARRRGARRRHREQGSVPRSRRSGAVAPIRTRASRRHPEAR